MGHPTAHFSSHLRNGVWLPQRFIRVTKLFDVSNKKSGVLGVGLWENWIVSVETAHFLLFFFIVFAFSSNPLT